jgi:hypothetical protein
VSGYDWDTCWWDYRYAAIYNLLVPVGQWASRLPDDLWRGHLERALLTFADLRCADLL